MTTNYSTRQPSETVEAALLDLLDRFSRDPPPDCEFSLGFLSSLLSMWSVTGRDLSNPTYLAAREVYRRALT